MKAVHMPLLPGQIVIHPHHGPATVTGFMTRMLRGREVRYAELTIDSQSMSVAVPVDSLEDVGVRDVADESQIEKLIKVLMSPTTEMEKNWSRRVKAFTSKILTGEPLKVAEVARDLLRRQQTTDLSMAEKEIQRDAMRPLVAEVSVAVNLPEEVAEHVLTQLILTGKRDILDTIPVTQAA